MSEEPIKPAIPFNQIVEALGNKAHAFPAKYLERFSDLSPVEIKVLEGAWESIDLKRRRKLLRDLDEEIELNTLVNFDDFARFALKDADPEVKISAIRLLRECDSIRLINEFIQKNISFFFLHFLRFKNRFVYLRTINEGYKNGRSEIYR